MKLINFKDFPSTETPISADNLNLLQSNVEEETTNLNEKIENLQTEVNDIVEIGENENGIYIKYSNGLLECRTRLQMTNKNTELHYVGETWYYPQEFVEIHGVQVTINDWGNYCIIPKVLAELTYCNVLAFTLDTTTNSFIENDSVFVNLVAYGKWK